MAVSSSVKILVLYDSLTGNVAEMARLVAAGAREIPGVEVRIRRVGGDGDARGHGDGRGEEEHDAAAADVLWADGIAVGSPTNMGLLSWRMKRFWDDEMRPHWMAIDGRIGCAFSSAGGWGGGMEIACQSILTVLVNFGFLVFGVTDYASRDLTAHYGTVSAKAPAGDEAKAACRLLGRRLAEWTAVLVHGVATEHPGRKLAERRPPHG
jgi:NAD(P)H dehydrogenase (quinone)